MSMACWKGYSRKNLRTGLCECSENLASWSGVLSVGLWKYNFLPDQQNRGSWRSAANQDGMPASLCLWHCSPDTCEPKLEVNKYLRTFGHILPFIKPFVTYLYGWKHKILITTFHWQTGLEWVDGLSQILCYTLREPVRGFKALETGPAGQQPWRCSQIYDKIVKGYGHNPPYGPLTTPQRSFLDLFLVAFLMVRSHSPKRQRQERQHYT